MAFDLKTAMPVKETETGDLQTQQFDVSTARITREPLLKPEELTGYQRYRKQKMDEDIKSAILQPLQKKDIDDILKSEVETPNALWAGVIPFVKGTAGFFTRPFGVEPFGSTFTPEELAAARGEHPVVSTIGDIVGGVTPFIATATIFPQGLLGTIATFGSVAGIQKIGRQQTEESIMTPISREVIDIGKEVGKAGVFAPVWHYSGLLQFVGRPYASALVRGGIRGVGAGSLSKVFGADLETSLREGGLITALSLIFEAPLLAKTALGRGIIKQGNRIAAEKGLPEGKIQIDADKLDAASMRTSIFKLAKSLAKLMKIKGRIKRTPVTHQKSLKVDKPVDINPKGPPAKIDNLTPPPGKTPLRPVGTPEFEAKPPVVAKKPPEVAPKIAEPEKVAIKAELVETAPVTKESVKSILGTRLERDIREFEKREEKRISLLDKAKLELKNINATIVAIRETPEFTAMGENIFEGKQELLRDLIADRKFQQEKISKLQQEVVTRRRATELQQRLKDIARGVREGKVIAKKEIKVVQDNVIKLFKEAGLDIPVSIKNIQTQKQLAKALPIIEERITKLAETAEKRALIADIKSETQKSKIKKLRPEFRDKIVPLVESIDLVKRKDATIKNLVSLAEFIEKEPENQIPQKRLNDLKLFAKTPIGELTKENLQTISDSINHFVKLNELKNKLIIKGKLREAREITNKSVENVSKKHEQLNESLSGLDSFQQEKEASLWNKIFGADSYNAELKCEILDGADHDIIMRVVFNEVNDGVGEGFKYKHSTEDFFKEKLKGIDIDKWSHSFQLKSENVDKVVIKISGNRTVTMSKDEAIAVNLHARNVNNTRHLKNGGFAFIKTPSKIIKLTEEDVNKIADSVKGDMLKVADAMYEHYNVHQKAAINKVSVDLLGHEVAIEPDYFPIRTDFLDRFKDNLIKTGNYSQKTLEGMGMFKERQSASNAILLEGAFVATYKSIDSVSAYVGLAKALRGAKTLLNNNDFQIAARNAGLNNYIESLKDYIRKVEGESINLDNVDKLTQNLINKLDVAILGPNPFVWFKQPISYMAAATEIDIKYLQEGNLKKGVTKAEIEEMKKYSPHIRDRLDGNVTREAGEVAQVGRVKRFFTGKEVLSAKFMTGLRKGDLRAISGIWRAVKAEVSEKSPNLKGDAFFEKVAERAWEVIRRTQPTFHIKDRSTIGMSKNVFIRLLTKYSSQRNKNWMIIRRAFEQYNRSPKTGKDKAKLAKALSIIAIISPLFLMAIDELRERIYGKKEDKRTLLRQLTTKYIVLNFGNIYFLGIGMNSLISKIDKGTYAGYDINTTLVSTMNDLVDTVANAIRSIEQSITGEKFKAGKNRGEKKWKVSLKKSAIGALDTAGKLTGIGIHTLRKIITGVIKLVYPEPKKSRGSRI